MRKPIVIVLLLAALTGAGWWWLRPKSFDAAAPLAYVPADTPYVMANLEPLPAALVAMSLQQMGLQRELLSLQIEQARQALGKAGADAKPMLDILDALQAEFGGKSTSEQLALLGLDPAKARFALYGLGLTPVLRVELTHPAALTQTIARIESRLGAALPQAKLGAQSYWQFGPAAAPVQGIAAVIDGQLVLSVVARNASEAVLRSVLGMQRPAQSLLASGGLAKLNHTFGFISAFSAYLDSARMLAAVAGDMNVADQALFAALSIPPPKPDPQCLAEYTALAQTWPRMVGGYTRLDASGAEALGLVEARKDIAAALMRLRAPMPGLKTIAVDTPFNLGFSVNLAELPKVVAEWAGAIDKAPWQCPQLAAFNRAAHDAAAQANNPALAVAAPLFSGLHAVLSTLQWPADSTIPAFTGRLVAASANPTSLLGMAKSMLPGLGQAQIPDDGSVVALPQQPGMPLSAPLFAAMRGHALALGIGKDEQAGLADFLASDAQDQPLLVLGVTGAFYGEMGQWQLRMLPADTEPALREQAEQQAQAMAALYPKLFRRVDVRIDLTARGIEMTEKVVMPPSP